MNLAYVLEERRAPIVDRPIRVLCFGEVLWDCKHEGRFPGGAPCNVAYHLHRIGCAPFLEDVGEIHGAAMCSSSGRKSHATSAAGTKRKPA
jgi:hypothetical protein